jgi:uncharacterized protein (DUF362 family)
MSPQRGTDPAVRPLTRSEFLKMAALAGGGAAFLAACGGKVAQNLGGPAQGSAAATDDAAPPSPRATRTPAAKQADRLAVAEGPSAAANVERAVAALGGMPVFVKRGDVVVVKPNMSHPRPPEYAVTTNPDVVGTLVRLAREAGAKEVLVMDNPSGGDPATIYPATGIAAAVQAAGGAMHIMGRPQYRDYAIPGHLLGVHPLYAPLVEADVLINVPVAKQHGSTGLTLAGKNMMGATDDRGRMHRLGLSESIAELSAALRPDLNVIDATRILVANGPSGGSLADVRVKDTVIAAADWVAADAYATRLFDKTPAFVPYIKAGADLGLGSMDLAALDVRHV